MVADRELVLGSVLDSVLEPVLDSALEPVLDSALESVLDSAPEPVLDSALEPVLDSALEPVLDSALEPVLDSALEPLPAGKDTSELERAAELVLVGTGIGLVDTAELVRDFVLDEQWRRQTVLELDRIPSDSWHMMVEVPVLL